MIKKSKYFLFFFLFISTNLYSTASLYELGIKNDQGTDIFT